MSWWEEQEFTGVRTRPSLRRGTSNLENDKYNYEAFITFFPEMRFGSSAFRLLEPDFNKARVQPLV
jgi:hypothetical protein